MSPLFAETSNLAKHNHPPNMETDSTANGGRNRVDDENYSPIDDYTPSSPNPYSSSPHHYSYTPEYYPTSSPYLLPPYNFPDSRPSSPHYTPNSSHFRLPPQIECPDNAPSSPRYTPTSSRYQLALSSPHYTPTSPEYCPTSPHYTPRSPVYIPTSSSYHPPSPDYSPSSPHYSPSSPHYTPSSPHFDSTSWQFSPYHPPSPMYSPSSPAYNPTPLHPASSPGYTPSSPAYTPSSPAYNSVPFRQDVRPFVHTNRGSAAMQRSNEIVVDEKYNSAEPSSPPQAAVFDCNICLGMAKDPVVTLCGHLFCWPCLHKWLNYHCENKECPVCKGKVFEDMVIPIFGQGFTETEIQKKNGSSRLKVPPRPRGLRIQS